MLKRLILSLIISLLILQPANSASALEGLVKFNGKNKTFVFLEVAVTDEEKSKGLMNRSSLPKDRGMVFVFRPPKQVSFWMKDTLIPLDMIFVYNGKIVKIAKNAIPNRTDIFYSSDVTVSEVIEVNGGYTDENLILVGDTITFENIAEIDYSKKSTLMVVAK